MLYRTLLMRWIKHDLLYIICVSTFQNLEKGKERELGFVNMRQKVAPTTKTKKTVIGFHQLGCGEPVKSLIFTNGCVAPK